MICTIWDHLRNVKNVTNTYGGVLFLVKLRAEACNFTKSNTSPLVFFTFLKLDKWYQIAWSLSIIIYSQLLLLFILKYYLFLNSSLTHLTPVFRFYTPSNFKNQRFFYISRGYRNWSLAWNGLISKCATKTFNILRAFYRKIEVYKLVFFSY